MRSTRVLVAAASEVSPVRAGAQSASAASSGVGQVRAATAAYHDISVAIAGSSIDVDDLAGIVCIEHPAGGMGVH